MKGVSKRIRAFEERDEKIANEMFENLKYLLRKYTWLEVYNGIWNTMANKMCGNVDAGCPIIAEKKRWGYKELGKRNSI